MVDKELAKGAKAQMMMLKRGARDLQNRRDWFTYFPINSRFLAWMCGQMPDHAVCLRAKENTSGSCVRFGGSTTKTNCKNQTVIAFRSAICLCQQLAKIGAFGYQSSAGWML